MSNTINRRDFLGGTALVIAAGLTPLAQMRAEPGRCNHRSICSARPSIGCCTRSASISAASIRERPLMHRNPSDPLPGNMVMWRGLTRLTDIELDFILGAKSCG
jgi:hypothetical protein